MNIREALDAGVNWIQLRFKEAEVATVSSLAEMVKTMCSKYAATLIVNDYPDIVNVVDAEGVHLGLTDLPVAEARKIVGRDKIIGGTANSLQDVMRRADEGCSYIGLGPLRFTETKAQLSPVLGFEGYQKIMSEFRQLRKQFPVYAIGGIVLEDVAHLLVTGVYGVAVSAAMTNHPNKKLLLQQLNTQLYGTADNSR